MSGPFVLDASLALAWCFRDEATDETQRTLIALASVYAEAPSLFLFEVQSVLQKNERRGKITSPEVDTFWNRLLSLDIRLDCASDLTRSPELILLARKYGLSGYDASYLELALRKGLPLGTADAGLRKAALSAGIALIF